MDPDFIRPVENLGIVLSLAEGTQASVRLQLVTTSPPR